MRGCKIIFTVLEKKRLQNVLKSKANCKNREDMKKNILKSIEIEKRYHILIFLENKSSQSGEKYL